MSRRRNHPEQAFQASLMKTLGMVLERETMVFAVPNGGARSGIEAAIMVGQGVIAGIPDLIVLWDGRAAGVECKAGDGRLTDKQKAVHERFARAGVPVAVVCTIREALIFLRECGVPMRLGDDAFCSAVSDNSSTSLGAKGSPQPAGCGSPGGARIGGSP